MIFPINRLPNEIQDIILNMYWQDIYSRNVINNLNHISSITNEIDKLYMNNIMAKLIKIANNNETDNDVNIIILYINNFFESLEPAQLNFLKKKYHKLNHTYIPDNLFFPDWCRLCAMYFLSLSGYMRYNVYHSFSKIRRPFIS